MPDIWGIAAILAKLGLYVGIVGSVGLVIIRAAFADLVSSVRDKIQRQVLLFAALTLTASGFGFILRGAALTGGAEGLIDPEMLGLLWQTQAGDALIYGASGTVLIMIGVLFPFAGHSIALAGGLIALSSFAQIGHVPAVETTGARFILVLHLLGIAFWVGVLGPLRALSRRPEHITSAAALGHRFGQAALVIVPGLILAGSLLAWLLLGDLSASVTTRYGQTLLIKVTLVGAALTLATANKLRFVPAMQIGDNKAARKLARSIEIEAAIILVVLAVTATLTSVLPLPT